MGWDQADSSVSIFSIAHAWGTIKTEILDPVKTLLRIEKQTGDEDQVDSKKGFAQFLNPLETFENENEEGVDGPGETQPEPAEGEERMPEKASDEEDPSAQTRVSVDTDGDQVALNK